MPSTSDDDFDKILTPERQSTSSSVKPAQGKGHKILPPKQLLQRLPLLLARVKAGNTSENILDEIRQIVYSLYQAKQISKKVYNNSLKSI